MKGKVKRHFSSSQIIILGFAGAIILGTLLLMLPVSAQSGKVTPFVDALFTAASAVCVTGLVVYDTATYWSTFGQVIILLLIQTGGLGVVTFSVAMAMLSGRKIGLMQRSTLQNALSAPKVGGVVRLTGFILKTAFAAELIGAVALSTVFCREFGVKGVWLGIFHSVSAFCNAGFDLMGIKGQFSSLTSYSAQPLINAVIMILIIVGGIGFLVWEDVKTNRHHIKKYCMQTKVVLSTTLVLIIVPAAYFYFVEFEEKTATERILNSLFQAVTPRTAGFNTVDMKEMSPIGCAVTIVLMLIGGSPGSTAGGMKTTTAAVLVFSAISVFRQKADAECFGRRIAESALRNAAAIFLMYITLFFTGGIFISTLSGLPIMDCMFEAASAIGTVGLTMGITSMLGVTSKAVLIGLMFFGRVGGLTLIFATMSKKQQNVSKKPQEGITVG